MSTPWMPIRGRRRPVDLSETGLQILEQHGAAKAWGTGIEHLTISTETWERLRGIRDENVQAGLLAHPRSLASDIQAAVTGSPVMRWGAAGASHVPGVADLLVQDESEAVRHRVACNQGLTHQGQEILASDNVPSVRGALAKRPDITPPVASMLARDEALEVRLAVATNHNAPADVLHDLVTREERFLWGMAASNPALSEKTIVWLARTPAREDLAANESSPAWLLDELYATRKFSVLDTLAANPSTREAHLHAILDQAEEEGDYLHSLSTNPRLPRSVLAKMPARLIRPRQILEHWDADAETLVPLARNWEGDVASLLEAVELVKR